MLSLGRATLRSIITTIETQGSETRLCCHHALNSQYGQNGRPQHYTKEQYGFSEKSSCEYALITAVDSWMGSIVDGQVVGALLIDLSKAVGTVPHQYLLAELADIGCSINCVAWFHIYLSNRKTEGHPFIEDN